MFPELVNFRCLSVLSPTHPLLEVFGILFVYPLLLQAQGFVLLVPVLVLSAQVTASRLLLSKQTIPHYYLTVDTCVDKLIE